MSIWTLYAIKYSSDNQAQFPLIGLVRDIKASFRGVVTSSNGNEVVSVHHRHLLRA